MKKELEKYAIGRIAEVGCANLPVAEMYTNEQWEMISNLARQDSIAAVFNALVIGFANGVEYGRAF